MPEVASVLRVSIRVLQAFFAQHPEAREHMDDGQQEGRASLRRKQFAMAEKNPAMAIWLGKQYLGQADKKEIGAPGDFDGWDANRLRDYIRRETEALGLGHRGAKGYRGDDEARGKPN